MGFDNNSRCGFVAIVGEPNAGKSTIINLFVGEKISIVSPKVQTTRRKIRGIVEYADCNTQIIFIDTPGFFTPGTPLEKALVSNFKTAYGDSDIILVVLDACKKNLSFSFNFIQKLEHYSRQKIAVLINKVDKARRENILKIAQKLSEFEFIDHIFMVSALNNDGINDVLEYLKSNIPYSHFFYPSEQKTDTDIRFRLSELTREKIYNNLFSELPYSIYVETELFKETEKKITVYQAIVVIKDSQKGIVLGKGGSMVKRIRDSAMREMNNIFPKKIELKLFVKVKENWPQNRSHLQNAGIIE
ncbi:MAG: GTPase Era [Holosporales bacterium]|jgi:GTP-binding protein Era|nr:GTPase Era [Holosporales bacterium]